MVKTSLKKLFSILAVAAGVLPISYACAQSVSQNDQAQFDMRLSADIPQFIQLHGFPTQPVNLDVDWMTGTVTSPGIDFFVGMNGASSDNPVPFYISVSQKGSSRSSDSGHSFELPHVTQDAAISLNAGLTRAL